MSLSHVLIDLAQAIDGARSLEAVCDAAVRGVTAVTGVSRAAILLFDTDGVMRFKASAGLSSEYRAAVEGHSPWSPGHTAPAPIVVPDVTREESLRAYRDALRRERIAALAFVPIVTSGGVIGKFMLYADAPVAFGDRAISDTLAIGYQIGLAVDRARREGDAGRAAEHIRQALEQEAAVRARLAELTTGAQRLLTAMDSAAVVHAVLELAESVIPASAYAVWLLHGDSWHVAAGRGLSPEFTATTMPRQVSIKFDAPVVADDVAESPLLEARRASYAREGIAALLSVPLIVRGESSGSIVFYYHARHRPTEIELQVATALGHLAAAAISNTRLYEEQQQLRRDAEDAQVRAAFLAEASSLLSSLDFERNLQRVAELAVPRLSDWCAVDLWDGDTIQRLAVTHTDPAQVALARSLHERYPATIDAPGVGEVIRTGVPQLYADIPDEMLVASARDAEHLHLIRTLQIQSAMVVPLTGGRRTFGAITFVSNRDRRRFSTADLEFAMELARRAALAIENARLFKEAREANRLKDEFLATLSHELRTPLNVIVGRVKGLRDESQPPDVRRVAETIERNAQALTRLVEDLLDVSRYVQGQLQLQVQRVDWQHIVQTVVASLDPSARAKGVRLAPALRHEPAMVMGDATRLQQIVWNLVTNAIKFTPADGEIAVSLALDGAEFVLAVTDTGVGISSGFLPHVFDLFRQEEAEANRRQGGLGLGLSIVKRIVDLHGGRVSAHSDGPGRGATFEVRLPCASSVAGQVGQVESDEQGGFAITR